MQLTGTVHLVLQQESGTSKNGKDWKKQVFIINYKDGDYDKQLALTTMGSTVEQIASIGIGQTVTVDFNAESREYNGRWYTDCKAWKVTTPSGSSGSSNLPF